MVLYHYNKMKRTPHGSYGTIALRSIWTKLCTVIDHDQLNKSCIGPKVIGPSLRPPGVLQGHKGPIREKMDHYLSYEPLTDEIHFFPYGTPVTLGTPGGRTGGPITLG